MRTVPSCAARYEAKVQTLQRQLDAAQDRTDVLTTQAKGQQHEELLSAASSIIGGFLSGRWRSNDVRRAASERSQSSTAGRRLEAAQSKVAGLTSQLTDLEADLGEDISQIASAWEAKAAEVVAVPVTLERSDVQVAQLVLAWVPVA